MDKFILCLETRDQVFPVERQQSFRLSCKGFKSLEMLKEEVTPHDPHLRRCQEI